MNQLVMNLLNNPQVNGLTHEQFRNMLLQYHSVGASQPPSQPYHDMYIDHTLLPGGLEQECMSVMVVGRRSADRVVQTLHLLLNPLPPLPSPAPGL